MSFDSHRTNTGEFLINAASLLPGNHHALKLLKSFYLTKSRKLSQTSQQRDDSIFNQEKCCQKCSICWQEGEFSMSVTPIEFTKRKRQRIQSQIQKNGKASKKARSLKLLLKKTNNVTILTCKFCGNRNKITLWKKNQNVDKGKRDVIDVGQPEAKRIDEASAVPADKNVSLQIHDLLPKPKEKKQKTTKAVLHLDDHKPNKPKKQSLNQNTKKQQAVGKQKTQNHSKPSPSMKRPSLLQLAAALKTKTKISDSSSKLKQMFK